MLFMQHCLLEMMLKYNSFITAIRFLLQVARTEQISKMFTDNLIHNYGCFLEYLTPSSKKMFPSP